MEGHVRTPIVSGAFYPEDPEQIRELMDGWFANSSTQLQPLEQPVGLIVPHAGYMYSGATAAAGFASIAPCGTPDVVILLGANHSGAGERFTLPPRDGWKTPLGRSPIDVPLRTKLAHVGFPIDGAAFAREHSMEVQLPFIQYLWGCEVPILPISTKPATPKHLESAARTVGEMLGNQNALLIASSDFTHYETARHAARVDSEALERITALDLDGFDRLWREKRLSICGTGAIGLLMALAIHLGLAQTEIIQYATSGSTTGDMTSVVGYAAATMTKEKHG